MAEWDTDTVVTLVGSLIVAVAVGYFVWFFRKHFGINSGNAPHMSVKKIAKVKDEQSLIRYILAPDATLAVQQAGIAKLSKPESLVRIASAVKDDAVFQMTLDRITDDQWLCDVLVGCDGSPKRARACWIESITKKPLTMLRSGDPNVRWIRCRTRM